MTVARQAATVVGSTCPNCKQEPCGCVVTAPEVPVAGEGLRSTTRVVRRYQMPDGSLVNLDEASAAAAAWAGAVPWNPKGSK